MRFVPTALFVLSMLAGCTPAGDSGSKALDPAAVGAGMEVVNAASIEEAVRYLSSDEMRGRGTGTADKERAAEWIAAELEAAGAVPLDGESMFQTVELIGFRKDADASSLVMRGPDGVIEHRDEVDFTWWPSNGAERVQLEDVPLVFVGHGITAPEVGWDDFGGADVTGKILVFLNDDPRVTEDGVELFEGETRTYYGRWTYKFEQARDKGAVGAIVLHTDDSAGYGWQVIGHKGAEEQFGLDAPGAGYDLPLLAWMREDLAGQRFEPPLAGGGG